MLVIDLMVATNVDLSTWRLLPSVTGVALLLYGLVWESR
jgi:hypothetical protein